MPGSRVHVALAVLLVATTVSAQEIGYQINRYEPTPAGEPFFAVEHPWYSSIRYFAGGLTFDYARNLFIVKDGAGNKIGSLVEHQLYGRLDLAASVLDRLGFSATIPLKLFESGTSVPNTSGLGPIPGVAIGDPRIGVRVRFFGQPEDGPASMSFGLYFWIPTGASPTYGQRNRTGEACCRVLPRLMFGGVIADIFRYSLNAGFLYRRQAKLDPSPTGGANNTVDSEVQLGVGAEITLLKKTLSFGPELLVSFPVPAGGSLPSVQSIANLEILGGVHYLAAELILLSVGAGGGLLGNPGPPDTRVFLRASFAPRKEKKVAPPPPPDRDLDGIVDASDACPDEPGLASTDARKNGCPAPKDRDRDGVIDANDICPEIPAGSNPDPTRPGCPAADTDNDGVFDHEDVCKEIPAGSRPDPTRKGCPSMDSDEDGIPDHEDKCPKEKQQGFAGVDPTRAGCPAPDADGDGVPDALDKCPAEAGATSTAPDKNGCPTKVFVRRGGVVILEQVFFDTMKATIQKRSFALLEQVATAIKGNPQIKKVSIEGHTDNKAGNTVNNRLSQKRAEAVMKFLVEKGGVPAATLEAHGYGMTRPIADNKTSEGRAKNRRVEFKIVDPPTETPAPEAPKQP